MGYVDYTYYTDTYLAGTAARVPEEEFPRYERLAELEIDARTLGRLASLEVIPDKVKDCACTIAELLYEANTQSEGYRSQGLAGPLSSWSNDGQSGTVDLGQSTLTETGRKKEITRLCRLYLGAYMFAGVMHYES